VGIPVLAGSCEPCPGNGRCYGGQLECIQGYKKYGKLCIEDGDINVTANKLVCSLTTTLLSLLHSSLVGWCNKNSDMGGALFSALRIFSLIMAVRMGKR